MKPEWNLFIDNYVKTNDHIQSYQLAYPGVNRKSAATKGKALLQKSDIRDLILAVQRKKSELVTIAAETRLIDKAANIITESELDSILSQIVRREIKFKRIAIVNGRAASIEIEPDAGEVLAAADKLYRRFGSFMGDARNPKDPPTIPILLKTEAELHAYLAGKIKLMND